MHLLASFLMTEQDIPLLLEHDAVHSLVIQSVCKARTRSTASAQTAWIVLINGRPLGSVRQKIRLFSSLDTVYNVLSHFNLATASLSCTPKTLEEFV